LRVDDAGRFPHKRGRELPLVPRVEGARVDDERWHLRCPAPVFVARVKVRRCLLRSNAKVTDEAGRLITIAGDARVEVLLVELADLVGPGVLPAEIHPQVVAQGCRTPASGCSSAHRPGRRTPRV